MMDFVGNVGHSPSFARGPCPFPGIAECGVIELLDAERLEESGDACCDELENPSCTIFFRPTRQGWKEAHRAARLEAPRYKVWGPDYIPEQRG